MVTPVRVVVVCCSDFWISVGQFLEQLRNMFCSLFDFLAVVPWQLRSSVVEFPWVATFELLESTLTILEYNVL